MQQLIGTTLGAYRIVEQIGEGGMATVYKAYQASMDRYVAIKVLPSHFTQDSSFLGRFTQEARTLARLEHPHILPVHDYGEQQGITYLVMRYVEAGTLKAVIAERGALDLQLAARIIREIGSAVDYAHSHGVVHRDIKPSNILVDHRGNTFLTDFGIARLVAETAQFTASGAIIGTPAYMSPEQGLGRPADHRSDIYALGVVLYELVTGRVPYEAETPLAVLLQHVNEPLPLPRQIKHDLPSAVERVILKAMAKEPEDRYQSAQALVDAFQQATTEETAGTVVRQPSRAVSEATLPSPEARPAGPGPSVPSAKPRRDAQPPTHARKRWPLVVGAVALLALIVVVAILVIGNLMDREPESVAVSSPAAVSTMVVTSEPDSTPQDSTTTVSTPATLAQSEVEGTWTTFRNANFVSALARHGDTLWVGGQSGLVRWNLSDGSYTEFGPAQGLASAYVNDLLVDDAGVIWIATDAGVSRFDGQTWTTFDETDGLDANWIEALFLDEYGGLWAGTRSGERGLNYFDGSAWQTPSLPPMPVDYPNVQFLGGNEEEGYFVGLEDQGLALTDGESWLVLTSPDDLPDTTVLDALLTDSDLWVSLESALVRFDLETGEPEVFDQEGIYAMSQAPSGELWFGGAWRAIRYDPLTGDWQEFDTVPGPIPSWLVTDIETDQDRVWLGTFGGGVAEYDGSAWRIWAADEELGGNWVQAIRQDGSGALWFTHEGSGLSRLQPQSDLWQTFDETDGALDWPSVPGIDSQGNVWIGDYGGMVYYSGEVWQTFTTPELDDVSIYAVEFGPGDVQWLATDVGLIRHDPATGTWSTFSAADHAILEDVWTFLVDRDGTPWAGGAEGVAYYDGSTWSAPVASGSAPQWVDDIAQAPDGSLWFAADGNLVHLSGGQWSSVSWPSDGWFESLDVAPDGSVWVGYEGLGRYEPSSGTWQMFTAADGLAHNTVFAIHVTPDGVVWIGTMGGVSRFVPTR